MNPTIFNFLVFGALAAGMAHAQQPAEGSDHPDEAGHSEEEPEEIVVQATRSGRRVQDEPIRVEVLNREEIEEKLLMRPGSIAMLVNETGGVRVQVTSPALGAANIRIQGMSGRYTQLLADGLPLYGGQTSSLGLGVLGEIAVGRVRLFINAENLLNARQTRHDPLLLPQRAADGRYTVDVWGPTDGFIVNGGVRLQL